MPPVEPVLPPLEDEDDELLDELELELLLLEEPLLPKLLDPPVAPDEVEDDPLDPEELLLDELPELPELPVLLGG
ncbi:MAG: hypothetical protein ACTS1Z_07000 [Parasphingopyxis sp.]|uniref:hypothetical protein n=1 Tax=Parasphingopyxis sp. TaxID=1920299 RepID=UPI003FA13D1B